MESLLTGFFKPRVSFLQFFYNPPFRLIVRSEDFQTQEDYN